MEKSKKTILGYEEIGKVKLEERHPSSKDENEKKLSDYDRLTNFILAGCKLNTTYFLLNFVKNGYEFDEQTTNEYLLSCFKSNNKLQDNLKNMPNKTIGRHPPQFDLSTDLSNEIKNKMQAIPFERGFCRLQLEIDFFDGEYLGLGSFWYVDDKKKYTRKKN